MSVSTALTILIYAVPSLLVYSLIRLMFTLRPNRLSTWKQIKNFYDLQKGKVVEAYTNNDLENQFAEAGLLKAGITPTTYRLIRDIGTVLILFFIHFQFFLKPEMAYPSKVVILIVFIYFGLIVFQTQVLKALFMVFKKQYDRRKNAEIFILQQIISNEYSNTKASKQNVYHMFLYMRKFLNYIQPAVDAFLMEYPRDPINKSNAYLTFAKMVGTPEAEALADILYQCDQASPDEIQEILHKRYEELRTKRQENYRSMMRDRGVLSYVLLFTGVLMVFVSAAMVYYMEYKDLVNSTFSLM